MKKLVNVIILLVVFAQASKCQKLSNYLELTFSVDTTTVGFSDPIGYNFTVKNKSKKELNIVKPTPSFYNPIIEFREINEEKWEKIYNRSSDASGMITIPQVVLAAKGETEISWRFIGFIEEKETLGKNKGYCFEEGKTYVLRGIYCPGLTLKEGKVYSNEVIIKIREYTDTDKMAVDWLKELPIPHFLFKSGWVNEERRKEAEHIIENFPDSKFKEWAELLLAIQSYFDEIQRNLNVPELNENDLQKYFEKIISEKKEIIKQFEGLFDQSNQIQIQKSCEYYVTMLKKDIEMIEIYLSAEE